MRLLTIEVRTQWRSNEAVHSPPAKDRPNILLGRCGLILGLRLPSRHAGLVSVSRSSHAPAARGIPRARADRTAIAVLNICPIGHTGRPQGSLDLCDAHVEQLVAPGREARASKFDPRWRAAASVWLIRRYLFAKGKCLVKAVERRMGLRTHAHPFLHALADHPVFPNVPATFAASAG